ncbi:MAG: ribonuclease H-like domain-containing protein [bacterium]|nr:ribonuclease H-like domain-containing protein [Candidatus Kapabacteria bacterium]
MTAQFDHLALDIETIPAKPLSEYSEATQQQLERRIAKATEYDPDMSYEKFASLNGDLGRIVCLSVGYVKDEKIRTKSFCGEDEHAILMDFNEVMGRVSGPFITYNGLGFDIPFILHRLCHHAMRPANPRFANTKRYQYEPHLDVMMCYNNWDNRASLPLGVLAETYGLPSPKGDLSGATVYPAYLAGEFDRIARYCEMDVATTLNLWRKIMLFQDCAACELFET